MHPRMSSVKQADTVVVKSPSLTTARLPTKTVLRMMHVPYRLYNVNNFALADVEYEITASSFADTEVIYEVSLESVSFECLFKCLVKLDLSVNTVRHTPQENGLTPV